MTPAIDAARVEANKRLAVRCLEIGARIVPSGSAAARIEQPEPPTWAPLPDEVAAQREPPCGKEGKAPEVTNTIPARSCARTASPETTAQRSRWTTTR